MGLKPLSVVFDYYAKDARQGNIRVVNQTLQDRSGLQVRVRVYDLDGKPVLDQRKIVDVRAQGVAQALVLPVLKDVTPVYFVRCELFDAGGSRIADNVYWQSVAPDRVGPRVNDKALNLTQEHWADFTSLQSMAKVHLDVKGTVRKDAADGEATVSLHNPSSHLAFFVRVEITGGEDGNEILPVTYDNNYVTVFPGESVSVRGEFGSADSAGKPIWVRVEGTNAPKELASIQ